MIINIVTFIFLTYIQTAIFAYGAGKKKKFRPTGLARCYENVLFAVVATERVAGGDTEGNDLPLLSGLCAVFFKIFKPISTITEKATKTFWATKAS